VKKVSPRRTAVQQGRRSDAAQYHRMRRSRWPTVMISSVIVQAEAEVLASYFRKFAELPPCNSSRGSVE